MEQLAARAAPSSVCNRSRPPAFGNMTKYLQSRSFVPVVRPIPPIPAHHTKKPCYPHGQQGQAKRNQQKEVLYRGSTRYTPAYPPHTNIFLSQYEIFQCIRQVSRLLRQSVRRQFIPSLLLDYQTGTVSTARYSLHDALPISLFWFPSLPFPT